MAYTLGDLTLPRPFSFERNQVEYSKQNESLNGRTTKDIRARKEQFVLGFRYLTQAEVSSILGEYDLQTTRDFAVTETNLTVTTTPVHIDIQRREYNVGGPDYREDITLILTEET